MNAGRFFLDANVLVYAADASVPDRQERARAIVTEACRSGNGCISTQVLQEYFVIVTRKGGVSATDARAQVLMLRDLNVVQVDADLVVSAIDAHIIQGLSFWDALIVKAAAVAGCKRLYSEDFEHDRVLEGVRIVNPFL